MCRVIWSGKNIIVQKKQTEYRCDCDRVNKFVESLGCWLVAMKLVEGIFLLSESESEVFYDKIDKNRFFKISLDA